MNKHW